MNFEKCYKKSETECVREKAYELWERDGRKNGNGLNYWLTAERYVKAQKKGNGGTFPVLMQGLKKLKNNGERQVL